MSDIVFNPGDRVRVVSINWRGATEEELASIGKEGTVVEDKFKTGLFVRVELDEKPSWWDAPYGIPFIAQELEKL